ncbi:unnamed protein product, partial [Cyprideis torosa]
DEAESREQSSREQHSTTSTGRSESGQAEKSHAMNKLLRISREFTKGLLDHLERSFFPRTPHPAVAVALVDGRCLPSVSSDSSVDPLAWDGFVFAVPVSIRTIDERLRRRYGGYYENKMLKPRTNLLICDTCGNYYEAGRLCPTCYSRISAETKVIQDRMIAEWGFDAVDKDVTILYEGETPKEELDNRKFIEMKKERPSWFHPNLLQRVRDRKRKSLELAHKPADVV